MMLSPWTQRCRKTRVWGFAENRTAPTQAGNDTVRSLKICSGVGVLQTLVPIAPLSRRALVRLQCRRTPMASKAEEDVLRAFKREVMEQRAIIIKALSEVSAFGKTFLSRRENLRKL